MVSYFNRSLFSLPAQAVFTISLLLSRSLGSPLVPLVSLRRDPMEMMEAGAMAGEAGAAMDMADMTAMGEAIFNRRNSKGSLQKNPPL